MEKPFIEDVRKLYEDGHYKNKKEYPSRPFFKEGHIFDEEKYVRWNKEERLRRIEEWEQKMKEYQEEQAHLDKLLENDVVRAIINEYGFNEKQALEIYHYAYNDYNEKHSHMNDVLYYIDEICDLFKKIQSL